jgi:bacterioferritin
MIQRKETITATLSQVLQKELTGMHQYFIHAKMCKNWGYTKLADQMQAERSVS